MGRRILRFFSARGRSVYLGLGIVLGTQAVSFIFHGLTLLILPGESNRGFWPLGSITAFFFGLILVPILLVWRERYRRLGERNRSLQADIEAKIQQESVAREREHLFNLFNENSRDILWITDLNLNITFISRAAEKLLGYSLEELMSKPFHEFFTPETLERLMAVLAEELAEEEKPDKDPFRTRIIETEQIQKNGSHLWVEIKATFLRDAGGKPVGILGFSQDITERKKAQQALWESEEHYRLIVEHLNEVVFIVTPELHITGISPSVERHLGYRPEELNGKSVSAQTVLTGGELEKALAQIEQTFRGESVPSTEYEVQARDGTKKYAEISSSPILRDGRVIGVLAVARNITDRKVAEKIALETEEKYITLVNNIPDIVYSLDAQGRVSAINESSLRPYGYTPQDLLGRSFEELLFPEDRERVLQAVEEEITLRKENRRGLRFRLLDRSGAPHWFEQSARSRYSPEGNYAGEDGVLRDITAAMEAEAEKVKLEKRLLEIQKMEAVGTLAGGIAHDFNNLLMGIQGYISLMLLETEKNHPHYEKLKNIEAHVHSGAGLTAQLLGFARGGRYEVKTVDLNDLLRRTAEMFGRTKKEISIHYQLATDLQPVSADPLQIEQVLINLFVNAAQAMPGGGDLYLTTQEVVLDAYYTSPFGVEAGRYVKLSVTDTGVGMDEKTQARIFEPFFTTKEMGRGTGLGLAMVYGIVKGHKGIINVYSEKGLGTTFNLYLPVSDQAVSLKSPTKEEILPGRETILLVDDEETILKVTEQLLKRLGYTVLTASNGEKAVEICRSHRETIDLLILDMIMPGMGGAEIFDRIKAIVPEIKVVLSSGYSLNGQAAAILRKGCQGFIQKPFNLEELSRVLRKALTG